MCCTEYVAEVVVPHLRNLAGDGLALNPSLQFLCCPEVLSDKDVQEATGTAAWMPNANEEPTLCAPAELLSPLGLSGRASRVFDVRTLASHILSSGWVYLGTSS